MKNLSCILFCIILFFIGCKENSQVYKPLKFNIPKVLNSLYSDTLISKSFEAEYITEIFPIFGGKYKFQDEINFNPESQDSSFNDDYLMEYARIGIEDSIDINGFEIIVDYKTTIKYKIPYYHNSKLSNYYPVYFVNSTNSDKMFLAKDGHAFGKQEALSKEGYWNWNPIEARGMDFCGNGRWGLTVHPGEFILVLMRKYEGSYETEMRVRFSVGSNVLVSKPFKGIINEQQFNIKDSSYIKEILIETNGCASYGLFYGASINKDKWRE